MADETMQVEQDRDGYFIMLGSEAAGWQERRVVHIKKTEHGYSGFVPSILGVRAQGDSLDDVKAALAKGVQEYIASRR